MKKQSGFTLIELMIAFVIGLIIIAATIGIYISTIRGSTDTLRSARLNHDLESAMSLMINDIRRAGYWGGARVGADSRNNPFIAATTNIQIPTAGCILYTYDANASGALTPLVLTDDVDANEYYGFKLDGTNVRMRKTGTTTADCDDGEWETLNIGTNNSSEKVEIDGLTFSLGSSKCRNITTSDPTKQFTWPCTDQLGDQIVETREVTITLSGHITGETTVSKTLNHSVKVRNDRIFTQ